MDMSTKSKMVNESREVPDSTQCSLESKSTNKRRSQKETADSSSTDWTIASRCPQPVNCSRCRYTCTQNITEAQRNTMCRIFHRLTDVILQKDFIRSHILESKPKTITTDAKEHRAVSRFYYLPVEDFKVRVCCKFFCKTLDVTCWAIEKWMKMDNSQIASNTSLARPLKSMPDDLDEYNKNKICQHINLFPTMASRTLGDKRFLEASLDIGIMYEHFKKFWSKLALPQELNSCLIVAENESFVLNDVPSEATYLSVFNSCFNLSFSGVPYNRCDDCCRKLPHDLADSSEHGQRHARADQETSADTQRMSTHRDRHFLTATVAVRNYLPIPCVNNSSFIYKRKLFLHNVTVHDGSNRGTCFVWLETEGRYGVSELGTVLYRYLTDVALLSVRDVTLFIETPVKSFQKQRLASLLLHAVCTLQLSTVELKFIVSAQDNRVAKDKLQVAVRHAIVYLTAFLPHDWINIIKGSRHKDPYVVKHLNIHDFIDLRTLADELLPNRNINVSGGAVNWSAVVCLRAEKARPTQISYKTDFEQEYFVVVDQKVVLLNYSGAVELKRAYETLLPISRQKKADLIALCINEKIPEIYHSFYRSLPSDDVTDDIIPDFTSELEQTANDGMKQTVDPLSTPLVSELVGDERVTCRQQAMKRGRWQDLVNASEQYYYQQQYQDDVTTPTHKSRKLMSTAINEEYLFC